MARGATKGPKAVEVAQESPWSLYKRTARGGEVAFPSGRIWRREKNRRNGQKAARAGCPGCVIFWPLRVGVYHTSSQPSEAIRVSMTELATSLVSLPEEW